jgi:PPOX class probable F420-dependent enzyme
VPITFALVGPDVLVTAIDHKPKSTRRLQRLANIERDPRVTVLVDEYDDTDWGALWWVRARGRGRVVETGPELVRAVDALVSRYPQYVEHRPAGPAIVVEITGWTAWAAAGPNAET